MIAMWMLWLLIATALVAVAARLAEEAFRGLGWPRRWVWAGAFVFSASLPWLGGLPALSLAGALIDRLVPPVASTPAVLHRAEFLTVPVGSDPRLELANGVLLGGWILASLTLAFVFGRALWRIRLMRSAGPAERVDGVEIVRSEAFGPAVVGIMRTVIVLPRWVDELSDGERELIETHEREHAMARDPLLLAAATLIVIAAPWCLPLWWMHRRLRDASETDCDARVLASGPDSLVYGRALLHAAGRPRGPAVRFVSPLLGGLNVSRLERRILMMTQRRPKHPVWRAVPLTAVAAVAAVVACDAAGEAVGGPAGPDAAAPTARAEREQALVIRETRPAATDRERQMPERGSSETKLRLEVAESDSITVVGFVNDAPSGENGSDASVQSAPVIYIDGERVRADGSVFEDLDPTAIESIEVIKGKLLRLYPPDHAAGVIYISTKDR